MQNLVTQINHQIINAMDFKFDTGDLFTNGKNHLDKILPGDFKITTPKNSLLSITSGCKYKESY